MSLYFATNVHSFDRGFIETKAWAFNKIANQMMDFSLSFVTNNDVFKDKEKTVEFVKKNVINAQADLNNEEKSILNSILEYMLLGKCECTCVVVNDYLKTLDVSQTYLENKPNFEMIFDIISKGYDRYLTRNNRENTEEKV